MAIIEKLMHNNVERGSRIVFLLDDDPEKSEPDPSFPSDPKAVRMPIVGFDIKLPRGSEFVIESAGVEKVRESTERDSRVMFAEQDKLMQGSVKWSISHGTG